jgi:outer membrane protein assembly factor BamA/autotransporter translocation and assembly factor TamB
MSNRPMSRRSRILLVVGLVLVGAVAAAFAIRPAAARLVAEQARLQVMRQVTPALGAPVSIGRVDAGFKPPVIVLTDLRLEADGAFGLRAGSSIATTEIRGSPLALARWGTGPVEFFFDRPEVSLRLPPGENAAPGAPGAPAAAAEKAGPAVPPGSTLRVRRGRVNVEGPAGLAFRCPDFHVDATLGSQAHPEESLGRAGCDGGALGTPLGEVADLSGQIGFAWSGDELRLDPVIAHGAGIDVSGRGRIGGLLPQPGAMPRSVTGETAIGIDASAVARWLPADAAPSGRLDAKLTGEWKGDEPRLAGTLRAPALTIYGVAAGDVRADVTLEHGVLRLADASARLFGGTLRGDLGVTPGAAGGWRGDTRVQAEHLDVAALLALAGWKGPAIRGRLDYQGAHSFDERGAASLDGAGKAALDGTLGGAAGASRPLTASLDLATRGRTLLIRDGSLHSGQTDARFSGSVSMENGVRLRLQGASGDLSELLPIFAAAAGGPRASATFGGTAGPAMFPPGARALLLLPAPVIAWSVAAAGGPPAAPGSGLERLTRALGGRWEWDGDLQFTRAGFAYDGKVAARDLSWQGVPLGALDADIQFASDRLTVNRFTLTPPAGGRLIGNGLVDFRNDGRLRVSGDFDALPLALAAALGGWKEGAALLEGTAGGHAQADGSFQAPRITADLSTGPVRLAGVPVDDVHGRLEVTACAARAEKLVALLGQSEIAATGVFPFCAGPEPAAAQTLRVTADGLDLARFAPLLGETALQGRARFDGTLQGGLVDPAGTALFEAQEVRLLDQPLGALRLHADIRGASLALDGALPDKHLTLEGRAEVREGIPVDLEVRATDLMLRGAELDPSVPEEISLLLAGRLALRGPLKQPQQIEAEARLDTVRVQVAETSASNEGPIEATVHAGRLTLKPGVLAGPGTRITFEGGCDVDPNGRTSLVVHGRFDLALLRTFVRGLQAEGEGIVDLHVSGPRRDPLFGGSLDVKAPHLRYPGLPFPIDDVDGRLEFESSVARISRLQLRAGGGDVTGEGELLLGKSGAAARGLASILAADVHLSGHGVSANFPEGFRSVSDPDLRIVYDPTGATLQGSVDVVRAVYSRDFKIEQTLLSGRAPTFLDLGPVGELPPAAAALRLDLALHALQDLWLRNDFGRIEGEADLRIAGTGGAPTVTGRINALEGSTITFNKVQYRVTTGTIDFNDPVVINPVFNLTADTAVGEYQITLHVEGTVDNFRYDLTSDPPLQQADIVAVLLTGKPLGTVGPGSSTISPENVSAYLAGTLTQQISSRFLGRAAPDVIAIDPIEVVTQGDPATRVTLGKQITPDLRVTYTDLLGTNLGATYQLDYRVARNVGIVSERDSDGSIGGDVRFTLPGQAPPLPWELSNAALPNSRVGRVAFEGDLGLPEETVRKKLRVRTGSRYDRGRINDRLDRLTSMYERKGYLMAELNPEENLKAGKVDLTVRVQSGPRLKVAIEGTGGRADLREALRPLWRQSLFLEDSVEEARARIESLVRDRGYRRASVEAQIEKPEEQGAASSKSQEPPATRIVFRVTEGQRVQADEVRIEGARQIEEKELRREIRSHRDSLFRRGIVRGDRLREDAAALHTFYVSHGFPEADVPPPDVIPDEHGRKATVIFRVHEGPRVAVGGLRFENAGSLSESRLRDVAKLPEGVPFTRDGIEAAAGRVRRLYDEGGWPDVRVTWRAEKSSGDDEREERNVIISVAEGARQEVAQVDVRANLLTDDTAIRRALHLQPHTPLSRADLLASQTRLYRLGIFRAVDLRMPPLPEEPTPAAAKPPEPAPPEPAPPQSAPPPASPSPAEEIAPPPAAAAPPAPAEAVPAPGEGEPGSASEPLPRPIEVVVREAAPIRQVLGLGYDTEEKIRGLYEIAERNLFGTGRYLGLQMRASDLEKRASVLYREQGVFGGRFDLLGSTYGLDENRPAFSGRTVGVSGQLSRDVTRATRLRYGYTLQDVNLSESTTDFTGSTIRLADVSGSGIHDTRDSPFDPQHGHYFAAELRAYGHAIGSQAQFAKAYLQAYTFRSIAKGTVWAQAVRAGAAYTFGESRSDPAASTGDPVSGVPQSERFYAGGDTTLRAFSRDAAGPLAPNGDPLGGEGLFLLNEELRFPVWRRLQGVLFTDIGNVYRTLGDYSLSFDAMRECLGAGLRFQTPIGPFRLEYGAHLDRQPGESQGQIYFSIGQAF